MSRPRDYQRTKLYRAEREVLPFNGRVLSLQECQAFIDKVRAYKKVARWFDGGPPWRQPDVTVKDGRRRRSACAHWSVISVPRNARNWLVGRWRTRSTSTVYGT